MSDPTAMNGGPVSAVSISVGAVIKRTFSVFLANIVPFGILALILQVPSLIYSLSTIDQLLATGVPTFGATEIVLIILSLVLSYVLMAALVYGTVSHMRGGAVGFGKMLSSGLVVFLPVFVIAILTGVIILAGLALLVVPGVFAIVIFAVIVPAYVVERPGIIGSFKRSMELTKGNRWQVLGVLVVLLIALAVFSFFVEFFTGIAVSLGFGISLVLIINYLVTALSSAVLAVGVAVLYHDLRIAKEGVNTEEIAAVFE